MYKNARRYIVIMTVISATNYLLFCCKSKHFKDKYFKPFYSLLTTVSTIMPSTLVFAILALAVFLMLCPCTSIAGLWICKPCENQAECDAYPGFCPWGEVRDACNRRICGKGPGERCGGSLNVLGKCGEGMMCRSDEVCHGCSLQTMECHME